MRMIPALFLAVSALCAQAPQEVTFSGQVIGPEGRPVADALVAAVPEVGEWDTARRARTNRDGRFQLTGPAAAEVRSGEVRWERPERTRTRRGSVRVERRVRCAMALTEAKIKWG